MTVLLWRALCRTESTAGQPREFISFSMLFALKIFSGEVCSFADGGERGCDMSHNYALMLQYNLDAQNTTRT